MSKRRVVIQHNRVVQVFSGTTIIKRLEHPQTGVRFELRICKKLFATSPDIDELVKSLDNRDFAQRVRQAFTMSEAPTIASLRPILPGFTFDFLPTRDHNKSTWLD